MASNCHEAYAVDSHLILLRSSKSSELIRALQASEMLLQVVDDKYNDKYSGLGEFLVSFEWGPFAVEKNIILVSVVDEVGLKADVTALLELAGQR